MILKYFNWVYFLAPITCLLIVLVFYFSLRKANDIVKTVVILVLMIANLLQHFLKGYIWPGYEGGFYYTNTAYNVCATLIILLPFIYISRCKWLNQCFLLCGVFAGMLPLLFPIWHIGKDILNGEFLRFATCHVLLFITSILPLLLGQYQLKFKRFWMTGLVFLGILLFVMLNLWISMLSGLVTEKDYLTALRTFDPFMITGPDEGTWLSDLSKAVIPEPILKTPFVWYALPLYLMITIVSLIVLAIIDHTGFKEFFTRKKIPEAEQK